VIAGINSGSVTRHSSCQRVAPSTRPASSTSRGRPSTAAKRMRNTNGTQCQMSTSTTDHKRSDGEPSQLTGPRPTTASIWLNRPKSWLYISLNMLPIATGGTRIGTIMSVRIRPLPRVMAPTSNASARPSTISAATAAVTKISVFTTVAPSPGPSPAPTSCGRAVNDHSSCPPRNSMVDTLMRTRLTIG
jgi:hypothetical protein